jgi:hypothetical protein
MQSFEASNRAMEPTASRRTIQLSMSNPSIRRHARSRSRRLILFSLDDVAGLTITTILLAVFGALLVAAYALWDLGADRLVAGFGRVVIRTLTFGRVRIAEDADEGTAMAISAATVLVLFLSVLIIASRVH